ncbi:MAG: response regulator transcription factor [Acidobacteriota bacterium]
MTTRVLIVDDHRILREGLRRILSEARDMEFAGEASTGEEALAAIKQTRPDVVLLDLSMPRQGGLETLRDLRRLHPAIHVLVLSMHSEEQFGPRVLAAGAAGYLTKESAPDLLLQAVRQVCRGGKFVSPQLAEILATRLGEPAERSAHELLSAREFEVLCLLADGKTVGEAGEQLSLSVKTISTYRTRILEKLRLKNNAEIMRYALQHGLSR